MYNGGFDGKNGTKNVLDSSTPYSITNGHNRATGAISQADIEVQGKGDHDFPEPLRFCKWVAESPGKWFGKC